MIEKLIANSLVKKFRQGDTLVKALNGIDLTIFENEFVAIMGASGSGKSTLLHAMAGLIDIDAGWLLVNDKLIHKMTDSELTHFRRENIGLVFQAYNLIPLLDARANIKLPVLGHPQKSKKADELLELLELSERARHRPDALSGGEQQRVAIARALITDPALILLDEPTGNLDSVAGEQICKLLRKLCDEQNRTIVVVTHEPSVARYADRVVVLKDGEIIDQFKTEAYSDVLKLTARYHHAVSGRSSEADRR